ncbi:MAG: BatA domain-containing protein [Planctomycetes bacterium]|nr:BatA domain-containing protein [Planctomycetota bacterium]
MFPWLTSFFANPALLGGAAAGSIPVIIHLLNKQRFKKVLWAAMHWLWAAQKKASRRQRIEQLILLLIRILILVLLALALARPALQEGMGLLAGRTSVYRVLVLDNSYSMGHVVGGQPLFEKAKDLAVQLVDKLNPGDEVDVLLCNNSTEELTPTNSLKHEEVKRDVKAAAISDGSTNLPRGIAYACRMINDRKSKNLRKEIIVITDRTRSGWEIGGQPKKLDSSEEEQIAKAFEDPKSKPKIWVARLSGGDNKENLVAASLEVEEKVVTARADTQLAATFKNVGTQSASKVPVTLMVDGEKVAREEIPLLEPLKPQSVVFHFTFPEAGSHAVSVQMEPDLLPNDNTAFLAVDVEDQVKVLCVDGQQRVTPMQSELDHFRQALSPTMAKEAGAARLPLFPEVISDGALPDANLDNYRLVVLGNVALIPPDKIEALKQYVARGGALWIWLGDRIDPAIYNKDLAALLPMLIGEPVGQGDPEGAFEKLSDKEMDHPAIAKFRNIKGLPMHELHVFRRFKLLPRPEKQSKEKDSVRTVLALEDGEPIACDMRLGEGRVMLVGTTADKDWNNWPGAVGGQYLPLVNLLALDLINPSYLIRNRVVGEAFEYHLPRESVSEARREGIKLVTPSGEPVAMDVNNETFSAVTKPVSKAGIYTAELPGEKKTVVHFAANRNAEESDLDTIDDHEIKAYLPANAGSATERGRFFESNITQEDLELTADDYSSIETSLKKHSSGKEIWRWLIGAVLVLLVVESFLARRFGDYAR